MSTAREQDENGFLTVKACPISSFGIFKYSAAQLGLPGDPNRIVNVFRPEDSVSDPACIDSFKNVPFIVDHEMLSGFDDDDSAESPDRYGVDGVLTGNVYYQSPWMKGDIRIFSRRAQKALQGGKKDLSLGYTCDFEVKSGTFNGIQYEVVQTNMRGNHIALVDEGRVPGARVLDGRSVVYDHLSFEVRPSDKEQTMKTKKKVADSAVTELMARLKALMPAFEAFLKQEEQEPEHQESGSAPEGGAVASAAPEGAEGAAAGAEGEAAVEGENEEDCYDVEGVMSAIAEAESILAELKAACGGEQHEGEPGADNVEGLATESSVEGAGGAEDESSQSVEASDTGEGGAPPSNGGRVSAGPNAGKHTEAGDAALRRLYRDMAIKDSLYNRISAITGTFPVKALDARQVAAYGLKKFGLKAADGQEIPVVTAYLDAAEKAKKDFAKNRPRTAASGAAQDAASAVSEIDAYLN